MSRPAARRALVAGDVMRDVLVRPEGPPIRGADRRAEVRFAPGGSAANCAAWLAALGVEVTFAGRVGAADLPVLEAEFRAAGVVPRLAPDPDAPTGALVALVDPTDGERSFLTSRGANDRLAPGDLPDALLDGADLVHVSGYSLVEPGPRAAVSGLVARAAARGVAVSVDPGSASFLAEIGAQAFFEAVAGARLLFPNRAEAAALTGETDPEAQAAALAPRFPLLAIKDGSGEARVWAEGRPVARAAPPPARMVDSTGAGDAFAAGFLAAWLVGARADAALAQAHATAARAISHMGARP
ncbi:MAG: PfkB family carbohydrate kinase [Pseudomonadota bacterium]|nr:PfkB family carbohydrate kinase [Pseudomonadota bacterium]